MKKLVFLVCFSLIFGSVFAQEKVDIYHPEANAKQDITDALAKAKSEGKHVFLQIGGNWCIWCIRFNKLVT